MDHFIVTKTQEDYLKFNQPERTLEEVILSKIKKVFDNHEYFIFLN